MFEQVKEVIMKKFGSKIDFEIKEDTRFDVINIDSIDFMEIIMALEDQFNIEFDISKASDLKTVGDVVAFIESKK